MGRFSDFFRIVSYVFFVYVVCVYMVDKIPYVVTPIVNNDANNIQLLTSLDGGVLI